MALEPGDGSITLAGPCCTGIAPSLQDSTFARYHADGTLDEDFDGPPANPGGGDGRVILLLDPISDDRPEDLVAAGGGRTAFAAESVSNDTLVGMIGPDGKLVGSFSGDGLVERKFAMNSISEAIVLDPAGGWSSPPR